MSPAPRSVLRYLTHPQVRIDPAVPVPDWGLSDAGRARVVALAATGWLKGTTRIVSSAERKAIETAEILAFALGLSVEIRAGMHENDRSATGFLPPPKFEAMADRFFAHPNVSASGWERATDAQARIVLEIRDVLASVDTGDILVVGHGAVGTLLYCHYASVAIDRRHDQPAGGGNYVTIDRATARVLHPWRPMEQAPETTG